MDLFVLCSLTYSLCLIRNFCRRSDPNPFFSRKSDPDAGQLHPDPQPCFNSKHFSTIFDIAITFLLLNKYPLVRFAGEIGKLCADCIAGKNEKKVFYLPFLTVSSIFYLNTFFQTII